MPILRQRVIVGYNDDETPIYKKVQASSVDKLNDRIVQAYVESGRIWEFIEPDGKPKSQEKTLFSAYVEKWLTVYKKPVLKPRTYQTYYGYLRSHLLPAFGDMYIEDITTDDVQRFLNDRKEQTRKSLKNYLALLKQILEAAKEDKIIDECPTESKRLNIPSDKEKPREALEEKEFRRILSGVYALEDSPEKLMLAMLLFTGMRRGEVLGLMWEDIDFDKRMISVQRNVTHPGNVPVIGTTKTKNGVRVIPFGEHFAEIVEPMKSKGFLFGGEKPISRKAFLTIMAHIEKKIDLCGATPHVLRHTYLTTLAGTNTDVKTLQAIAGHADIQTTMNVYVHPKMENIREAGNVMDTLLNEYAVKQGEYTEESRDLSAFGREKTA